MSRSIFALVLAAIIPSIASATDVIRMKNGDVYRGEILKLEPDKHVQLLFKDGNEKSIDWADINVIEKEPSAAATPVLPPSAPAAALTPPPTTSPGPAELSESDRKWWIFFSSGLTYANASSYTLNNASNVALFGSTDKADSSSLFSLEAMNRANSVLGISVLADWSKYNYQGSTPADTEVSIMVMPRAQTTGPGASVWAGFAVGYVFTTIGLYSISNSTYTVSVDKTPTTFAISPRIGADINISERITLGLQMYYFSTSGKINGTVVSRANGASASFNYDVTRHWIGTAVRVGVSF